MDYQDAIARLGIGSAHPGGFHTTEYWMDRVELRANDRVLEVGCGTGRTACALYERFSCDIIGVDLHPMMIEKARQRANQASVPVHFQRVAKGKLPFSASSFDVLVAESVTVFNPINAQLHEYKRVLKSGGMIIDTEMCAAASLPQEVADEFKRFYKARAVPTIKQWKAHYENTGFSDVRILLSAPVSHSPLSADVYDPFMQPTMDERAQEVMAIAEENDRVMRMFGKWLQYAVIIGRNS